MINQNLNFVIRKQKVFDKFNTHTQKKFSKLFNDDLFIENKKFAANFKDSIYHKVFYDISLQYTLNSLFLINKEINNIVFVGPNPYLFLEKLPPSKYLFL
jgi:hypothetical protein